MESDYHKQPYLGGGEYGPSREHQLFATVLANIKLDPGLGFLCGAAELEVLHDLSIRVGTRSPRGERWEALGYCVFTIIEAQRLGEVEADMFDWFQRVRAEVPDGLPVVHAVAPYVGPDEVSEGPDVVTEEGGYLWHTDGRPPEPVYNG